MELRDVGESVRTERRMGRLRRKGRGRTGHLRHAGMALLVFAAWNCAGLAGSGVVSRGTTPRKTSQSCVRISLEGEVSEGQTWSAAIGEGWLLQLVPIRGRASGGAPAYSGWDIAVNRANAQGYPDALLLATPPYGSLNAREIGTTFGMRAQDAIAWEPRHFHFLTSVSDMEKARMLYARVMPQGKDNEAGRRDAGWQLLTLLQSTRQGSGQLQIEDARLVPGTGDPPAFAQGWAQHLEAVPHTYEQSGARSSQGQLQWMRFSIVLWLPQGWRVAPALQAAGAKCAE